MSRRIDSLPVIDSNPTGFTIVNFISYPQYRGGMSYRSTLTGEELLLVKKLPAMHGSISVKSVCEGAVPLPEGDGYLLLSTKNQHYWISFLDFRLNIYSIKYNGNVKKVPDIPAMKITLPPKKWYQLW
jgi:hypothetical protein